MTRLRSDNAKRNKEIIAPMLRGRKRPPFSDIWKKKISEAKKGHKVSEETRKKISLSNKGKKHSEETKKKMSEGSKGRKTMLGKHHSEETKEIMSKKRKGKYKEKQNPNWKGGITPENIKIRSSIEYDLWHKSILTRDNFICQKYGTRGGDLVAHHINNFADYPELRLAIDNGITLSEKAHREFHKKYGNKNNTKEQLEEFLNFY